MGLRPDKLTMTPDNPLGPFSEPCCQAPCCTVWPSCQSCLYPARISRWHRGTQPCSHDMGEGKADRSQRKRSTKASPQGKLGWVSYTPAHEVTPPTLVSLLRPQRTLASQKPRLH